MSELNQSVMFKVEGMTCTGCASAIEAYLNKQHLKNIQVSFVDGWVKFDREPDTDLEVIAQGINQLGYKVIQDTERISKITITLSNKLWISILFTLPLILHHIFPAIFHFLHFPWIQFLLALPPITLGLVQFLPGAMRSVRSGSPNMDVTVCLGALAATWYSLIGWYLKNHEMIFFETGASILTLVLLGNFIEQKAIKKTTNAIDELQKMSPEFGKMKMPSGTIVKIPISDIQRGDLLIVSEGDAIPADGTLISGTAMVDESVITGESRLLKKKAGDEVIGSSRLISGNGIIKVARTGGESYFGKIIQLVKNAAFQKAPIQNTADKISAVFVPVILMLSVLAFSWNYAFLHLTLNQSLLRAIAVLVISCPCAMGLATPVAIMVGLGKAMKEGILIKGAVTLEQLGRIKQIVFDKTGTLTTPEVSIKIINEEDRAEVMQVMYAMESRSSHPIAQSVLKYIESRYTIHSPEITVIEHKGRGMKALAADQNKWEITWSNNTDAIEVFKNDEIKAEVVLSDQLKEGAEEMMSYLKQADIKVSIISGDDEARVGAVAKTLSIADWSGRVMPDQKITFVNALKSKAITAMVGDGINDAPALSSADLAISFGNASNAAIQSSQVILLNENPGLLTKAIQIGKKTLSTIRQNLFWAFSYNIVAIPLAALGYLNPMWGAAFMAFSDLVVVGNSMILRWRKI